MNKPQKPSMLFRAMIVSCALAPHCVSAKTQSIPFTPLEQMATLTNAASQAVALKLYHAGRQATIARQLQRDYRARYLLASPGERITIAMTIGEEGVERFAAGRPLKVLLPPKGRSIPIGPDSTYWDRKSGTLRVLEAKGGTSPLKWTYGSLQGTNTNAIRSAEGFLRKSGTTWKEKLHAARLITAAKQGHLETAVVRTAHELGRPRDPRRAGSWDRRNVANAARKIERELIKHHPQLRRVFRIASFLHHAARVKYGARSRLSDLASTTARSIGLGATQRAALWRIGKAGTRSVFPIAVGVSGGAVVAAYFQYASGLIPVREFYRTGAGPTIFVVFTATGAIAGVAVFGVGVAPGAALGAMAALPVEVATDWVLDRYFREFDLRQTRLVDAAVEEHYGVDAMLFEES